MKTKLVLILAFTLTIALLMAPRVNAPSALPGDINGDGKVNILDVTSATSQYMLTAGNPKYNSTIVEKADLAPPYNGIINILDLVTLISHYSS
jgi:hypothetical protein